MFFKLFRNSSINSYDHKIFSPHQYTLVHTFKCGKIARLDDGQNGPFCYRSGWPKKVFTKFSFMIIVSNMNISLQVCVLSTISKEVLGVYQLFHIGWYPMLTFISAGISEAMNLKVTFR